MSKYVDVSAIAQVIGNVFNNPSLLDREDKYIITENDFPDIFHKVIFGAIYKIYELGAEKITIKNVSDFLAERPKSNAVFEKEKGEEWLLAASENATANAFDFYYGRLKKMSLLRAYDNCGVDVTFLYDPDNIMDLKKKQMQEDWIDNHSLEKIAERVDEKLETIKAQYVDNTFGEAQKPSDKAEELFARLKEYPDVGVPLYGPLINTVTRGARLRKMYLRSAASGFGKSRTMIADVCNIGCNRIFNEDFGWIENGIAEPVLYITTEQELEEIQTMMWAFLSNVNEEHILNNNYEEGEEERVKEAIRVLKESKIYIIELPDFSLKDVENLIKKNIRENGVKYVVMDYIMTSLKILSEITQRSGGVKIREDNVLFMLSRRLKDIANEYGVFVLSASQLNGSWQESETPDQNLLRGAKSLADSIDVGLIILPVTKRDIEKLEPVLATGLFEMPNMKISVYKNRRGRYKSIYLWCNSNLGTCRVKPMFATTWNYELIQMNNLVIDTINNENCAFERSK